MVPQMTPPLRDSEPRQHPIQRTRLPPALMVAPLTIETAGQGGVSDEMVTAWRRVVRR